MVKGEVAAVDFRDFNADRDPGVFSLFAENTIKQNFNFSGEIHITYYA
jgi:hypothetical protein